MTVTTANDNRATFNHYDSADYGPLTYSLEWYYVADELRSVYVYRWSDGVDVESPSLDQLSLGMLGIIPDVYNTTEYCEIMEGDTCPV